MTLAAAFEGVFGRPPEGIWSAPGRVNLIGEHTDYNGGLALPIGLSRRTYAACGRTDDDILRVHSLQNGQTVTVALHQVSVRVPGGWAAYVAGVVWALREAQYPVGGLDIAIDGHVPLGAGLSSSAALECAVGAACSDLFSLGLLETPRNRAVLAACCKRAENEIAGAPTGGLDQSASLLAQAHHALLLDCRDGSFHQVPFPLEDAGLDLLVIDTRASHALVDGQYAARRASCEEAARRLGVDTLREVAGDGTRPGLPLDRALELLPDAESRMRVRHVVTEIDRVGQAVAALESREWQRLGGLFLASHASLRDDFEVSCDELDLAVATAVARGALGARMTGGGFGGSAIALVPQDRTDAVATAVTLAFESAGFAAPECFAVTAARGADRDE